MQTIHIIVLIGGVWLLLGLFFWALIHGGKDAQADIDEPRAQGYTDQEGETFYPGRDAPLPARGDGDGPAPRAEGERSMKPHIRMINGRWSCCGRGREAFGSSPINAFRSWAMDVMLWGGRCCQ